MIFLLKDRLVESLSEEDVTSYMVQLSFMFAGIHLELHEISDMRDCEMSD